MESHLDPRSFVPSNEDNEKRFNQVLGEYSWLIKAVSLKIMKHKQDAEDAVSEIFVKVWIVRAQLSEIENLSAYIYRMTQNHCLDKVRSNQRRGKRFVSAGYTEESLSPYEKGYEEEWFAGNVYRELERIVLDGAEALPPQRRRIFQLKNEGELSNNDIAKKLGISPKTVSGELKKAKQLFLKLLKSRLLLILLAFSGGWAIYFLRNMLF